MNNYKLIEELNEQSDVLRDDAIVNHKTKGDLINVWANKIESKTNSDGCYYTTNFLNKENQRCYEFTENQNKNYLNGQDLINIKMEETGCSFGMVKEGVDEILKETHKHIYLDSYWGTKFTSLPTDPDQIKWNFDVLDFWIDRISKSVKEGGSNTYENYPKGSGLHGYTYLLTYQDFPNQDKFLNGQDILEIIKDATSAIFEMPLNKINTYLRKQYPHIYVANKDWKPGKEDGEDFQY